MKHRLAGLRLAAFQKAQMPGGCAQIEREVELAQPGRIPPVPQEASRVIGGRPSLPVLSGNGGLLVLGASRPGSLTEPAVAAMT